MTMTPERAGNLRNFFVECLEPEQKTFINVVKAMPDAKLSYKPESRIMDFGTLAVHTARSGAFFTKTIHDGAAVMGEGQQQECTLKSNSEVVAEVEGLFRSTLDGYRSFTPEQLARNIDFFGMGAHPGVMFLNWDIVHLIHHRAQLGLYLRLAGEKVPSIYGPTLDVSFEDLNKEGQPPNKEGQSPD